MLTWVMTLLAAAASADGNSTDGWSCRNQVEVWCGGKTCRTKPPEETTPLSVHVSADGHFSACAYSGCWNGTGQIRRLGGRFLLSADNVPFTSEPGMMDSDVTVLIIEKDGIGFLRVNGLASPLICTRSPPD